jgi:hypothetical protein
MQIFFSKTMDEKDNAQKNKAQKTSKRNTRLRIYLRNIGSTRMKNINDLR